MGNAVALPIQPLPSLACSERRIYALCVAHCQAVSRVVRTLESQHVQASSTAAAARSDEPVGRAAGATSTAAEVLGFICSRRLDAALTTSACHCPQLVDLAFVQLLENAFSVKSPACACPACLPCLPASRQSGPDLPGHPGSPPLFWILYCWLACVQDATLRQERVKLLCKLASVAPKQPRVAAGLVSGKLLQRLLEEGVRLEAAGSELRVSSP